MNDFGLFVGRYSATLPSISVDNTLREVRLDAGGRLINRTHDGNDNTLSYFADGDAVNSGIGNFAGTAGDRGMLLLGKDTVDSIYKVLKVNSDGSLVVSTNTGTDISAAADKANAANGQVPLVQGTLTLIQSIPITSGHFHISGWSYGADKNALFQLAIAVHSGAGNPVVADITEILDSQITSSSRPSDHVPFGKSIDRAGAANTYLCVFAIQNQAGSNGKAISMINVDTTT